MESERKRRGEEGMKRTQRCIKLFPHRRGVDKKTLSKPERALHSDGERRRMKENKRKWERERGRERETGKKEENREKTRAERQTEDKLKTETNAASYFFPSPSTFPHFL